MMVCIAFIEARDQKALCFIFLRNVMQIVSFSISLPVHCEEFTVTTWFLMGKHLVFCCCVFFSFLF